MHRQRKLGSAAQRDAVRPQDCTQCTCRLVEPTYWRQVAADAWRLDLRCPECGAERIVVLDGDSLHAYNVLLYRSTDELALHAKALARECADDEAASYDAFLAALREDRILPMDF